jgi:hypothetical protein
MSGGDNFDVLRDGVVVGRIFKANVAPVGASWMWTLAFGRREPHAYARLWRRVERPQSVHSPKVADGSERMMSMFRRPSGCLAKKLGRPLRTTDGGTLHTVLEARAYMVSLLKRRELRGQWQRARELLLTEAHVGKLTKALELALFYDSKVDLMVRLSG